MYPGNSSRFNNLQWEISITYLPTFSKLSTGYSLNITEMKILENVIYCIQATLSEHKLVLAPNIS